MRVILLVVTALTLAAVACEGDRQEVPPAVSPQTATPAETATPSLPWAGAPFPLALLPDEIAVVNTDGTGRQTLLTTGEIVGDLEWLPDGRLSITTVSDGVEDGRLVEKGRFYLLPREGGESELRFEGNGPLMVQWSPDMAWAAVHVVRQRTDQEPRLFLLSAEGEERLDLGPAEGRAAWSPDGRYFFISAYPAEEHRLMYVVPSSEPQRVLPDGFDVRGWDYAGVFPNKDFSRLVIPTYDQELVVVDLGLRTAVEVAGGPGTQAGPWASDGQRFLYTTGNGVGLPNPRLWIYDASAGKSELLVSGRYLSGFDWSPDGSQVAYAVHGAFVEEQEAGLYVIDLSTRETHHLVREPRIAAVRWSPDGRAFALPRDHCWQACESGPIDVLLLAEGELRTLPAARQLLDWSGGSRLAWGLRSLVVADSSGEWQELEALPDSVYRLVELSPDRETVAFVRSKAARDYAFEVNVKTGAYTPIDPPPTWEPEHFPPYPTVAAPDGSTAVALAGGDVVIRRKDAREPIEVDLPDTPGCGSSDQPVWSLGGTYLAYSGCLRGVYVIEAKTGRWIQVTGRTWCHFIEMRAPLRWVSDDTLVITAVPTLC